MIQRLQTFFHTDKWWGKLIFIFCTYLTYVIIGYIIIPFIVIFFQGFNFGGAFLLLLLFIFIPGTSYLIPLKFFRSLNINKILLYCAHTIFVILISFLFILLLISGMNPNFF